MNWEKMLNKKRVLGGKEETASVLRIFIASISIPLSRGNWVIGLFTFSFALALSSKRPVANILLIAGAGYIFKTMRFVLETSSEWAILSLILGLIMLTVAYFETVLGWIELFKKIKKNKIS